MKDKYFIFLVLGYCSTLLFEFGDPTLYVDWFLGADIKYPEIKSEWGNRAGTFAISLEQYLHDIGEHLHVISLYLYILLNNRHDKPFFFLLLSLFVLSLLNYLYNYHRPLFWKFDLNYAIVFYMLLILVAKSKWFSK